MSRIEVRRSSLSVSALAMIVVSANIGRQPILTRRKQLEPRGELLQAQPRGHLKGRPPTPLHIW
jgi:hypothetical protein